MRWPACALALGLAILAPYTHAADEEIQVYLDDLSAPGQFGVDVHSNFVPARTPPADGGGTQAPGHVFRLTPEFYYGLTPDLELGLYLLTTHTAAGDSHFDGSKLRLKYVAPHDATGGFFWGANLEFGATSARVAARPWNAELKGILGYRAGPWLLALNPNLDASLSAHGGPATLELDFKIARDVGGNTQLGVESYDGLGPASGFAPAARASRVLYLALDHDFGRYDLNAGIGRGLTAASDPWVVKFIVGHHFGGP